MAMSSSGWIKKNYSILLECKHIHVILSVWTIRRKYACSPACKYISTNMELFTQTVPEQKDRTTPIFQMWLSTIRENALNKLSQSTLASKSVFRCKHAHDMHKIQKQLNIDRAGRQRSVYLFLKKPPLKD